MHDLGRRRRDELVCMVLRITARQHIMPEICRDFEF